MLHSTHKARLPLQLQQTCYCVVIKEHMVSSDVNRTTYASSLICTSHSSCTVCLSPLAATSHDSVCSKLHEEGHHTDGLHSSTGHSKSHRQRLDLKQLLHTWALCDIKAEALLQNEVQPGRQGVGHSRGPGLGHGCHHLHQSEVLIGLLPCCQVQQGGTKPPDVSVRPSCTKLCVCLLWSPVCLHVRWHPAEQIKACVL